MSKQEEDPGKEVTWAQFNSWYSQKHPGSKTADFKTAWAAHKKKHGIVTKTPAKKVRESTGDTPVRTSSRARRMPVTLEVEEELAAKPKKPKTAAKEKTAKPKAKSKAKAKPKAKATSKTAPKEKAANSSGASSTKPKAKSKAKAKPKSKTTAKTAIKAKKVAKTV